jgi:hypothetical protein
MKALAGFVVALTILLGGIGCGTREYAIHGDPDGVPVTLSVTFQASAIPAIASKNGFIRTIIVEREDPFIGPRRHLDPFPCHSGFGTRYQPATRAVLLAGDGPAQAQLMRVGLEDGANSLAIPIRAGRTVTLTLQTYGGWEGWTQVGKFTVNEQARVVDVAIDQDGGRIEEAKK